MAVAQPGSGLTVAGILTKRSPPPDDVDPEQPLLPEPLREVQAAPPTDAGAPSAVATRAPPPAAEPEARDRRLRLADLLLPVSVVLWALAVAIADAGAMDDYGLLAALPAAYFVAAGLLVVSTAVVLTDDRLSPVRLALHLAALVVVLHGTVPAIFSTATYPWLYKHVGVVAYLNANGDIDSSVDIYQNWPGFFTLAAWFTRLTGAASPLSFAAWAPVYFNVLSCLVLMFAFRQLPVSQRARWTACFLFVAANWVGQDYFAPQAMTFLLSVGVVALVLAWMRSDRLTAVGRGLRGVGARLARTPADGEPPAEAPAGRQAPEEAPAWLRMAAFATILAVHAVVVFSHQLSPYVVIFGVTALAVCGLARPWWVVALMVATTVAYLFLRMPYVDRTQDLWATLGEPFRNLGGNEIGGSTARFGRRVTALGAPLTVLTMWGLAVLGVYRRLRRALPTMAIALLAAAPLLIAFGQRYGGEAVFRIYLFSLPWAAVLAAAALAPRSRRRPARVPAVAVVGVPLLAVTGFWMSAVYGAQGLYEVRAGEVEASRFFYESAEPTSVLMLAAPHFPGRIAANYDEFGAGENTPDLLTTSRRFRHRMYGDADVPAISAVADRYLPRPPATVYLAVSRGQKVYSELLGHLPTGSLDRLEAALDRSPAWERVFTNADSSIFRYLAPGVAPVGMGPPRRPARPPVQPATDDGALVGIGISALVLLVTAVGVAVSRRGRPGRRRPSTPPDGFAASEAAPAHEVLLTGSDASPKGIEVLQRLLADDPGVPVRLAAVRALSSALEDQQLRALRVALQDRAPEVRGAAVERLALRSPEAIGEVVAHVGDASDAVRHAIGRRLSETAPALLWEALRGAGHPEGVCGRVGEVAPEVVDELVLDRLRSADASDRRLALRLASETTVPAVLDEVVTLASDPDVEIRKAALQQLGGRAEAVPTLAQALRDADSSVRLCAARGLAAVRSDDAAVALVAALTDSDVAVQRTAIEALASRTAPEVAGPVATALSQSERGSDTEALTPNGQRASEGGPTR